MLLVPLKVKLINLYFCFHELFLTCNFSYFTNFFFSFLDTVSLTQILAHQPVSNEVMDPHSLLLTDAATDSDMVIGRLLRLSVTLVMIYFLL